MMSERVVTIKDGLHGTAVSINDYKVEVWLDNGNKFWFYDDELRKE